MADYTVNIDLPDHKRGDRWIGIPAIGPVIINTAQPTNALTRVRMQFRDSKGRVYKLDSDATKNPDAPIVIDDEDTWEVSIPEVQDFISVAGEWDWDMEFYEAGKTKPLTLYKGVLTVYNDITK